MINSYRIVFKFWAGFCLIFLNCSISACTAPSLSSNEKHRVCSDDAKTVSGACRVSPIRLLINSDVFSGGIVDVVLFYPGMGSKFLFVDAAAADVADLTSAFFIADDLDVQKIFPSPGYYKVEGAFSTSAPIPFGEGVVISEVVGGRFTRIDVATKVRVKGDMVDSCKIEGCRVIYAEGAYLVKVLPVN